MLYCLKQGPTEQNIIRQCFQQGLPLPKSIAEAPEISAGLELFFQAFMELNTCRSGMGDGPIHWTAVDLYCERLELDEDTRDEMFHYIRAMDDAWRKYHQKKNSQSSGATGHG